MVEFSRTQESQEWEPKVVFRGGRHVLGLDKGEEQIGKKKKICQKSIGPSVSIYALEFM